MIDVIGGRLVGIIHDGGSEEILQRHEENGFEEADESHSETEGKCRFIFNRRIIWCQLVFPISLLHSLHSKKSNHLRYSVN